MDLVNCEWDQQQKMQNNIKMADNIVFFCLYYFRYVVIIAINVWRPTLRKHTETDHDNLIHLWKDIKKCWYSQQNKIGVASSYHNEQFKTDVAVKEIINLKYEIDKIKFPTKIRKGNFKLKKLTNKKQSLGMPFNKTIGQIEKWRSLGMNKVLAMQKTLKVV